ncbi:hypothetical protein ABEB36_009839 [Hypothenemus hampei]|uniref:Protein C10 n=1 Tax=Hypothenemus hampei TaxID=57062 RepID=A0ABD1ELR1_HYPHA
MEALSSQQAVDILNKTLNQLNLPENNKKLEEARENVGNEMLKMMQFIFPIVMEIQLEVIKEYGFPETREGIVKFSQMIRSFEKDDAEVARLHSLIKAYYMPPMAVHTNTESSEEKVLSS